MFAIAALVCFLLGLFHAGVVDWVTLGLAFIAAHLIFGLWPVGAYLGRGA